MRLGMSERYRSQVKDAAGAVLGIDGNRQAARDTNNAGNGGHLPGPGGRSPSLLPGARASPAKVLASVSNPASPVMPVLGESRRLGMTRGLPVHVTPF